MKDPSSSKRTTIRPYTVTVIDAYEKNGIIHVKLKIWGGEFDGKRITISHKPTTKKVRKKNDS